jgi:integrase
MIQLQAECAKSEQLNTFLADGLDAPSRQEFLAHLGVCEACAAALSDLREDERLLRVPLTSAERDRIRRVVRQARHEVTARLEDDRRRHEQTTEAKPLPVFPALALILLPSSPRRVIWLAMAVAWALAASGWWFFRE